MTAVSNMDAEITLFRQSANAWAGGSMVHVLDRTYRFMLIPPSPCHAVLADILAEKVTVEREALMRRPRAELENRGYCRHCFGTLV